MRTVLALLLAASASGALAEVDGEIRERIRQGLEVLDAAEDLSAIRPTPFADLYEVVIGPRIVYMSGDGRYVLSGDLMDLEERRNISAEHRAQARAATLAELGPEDTIEFAPPDPRHVLYVFTDIDCGYCRRLHTEIDQLMNAGIAVRYLAFPRAGVGSESYDKFVSVWCSKDPRRALTRAKAGEELPPATCENPVAAHYQLGDRMGVRGTPSIMLESGEELGGHVPADQLKRILGEG